MSCVSHDWAPMHGECARYECLACGATGRRVRSGVILADARPRRARPDVTARIGAGAGRATGAVDGCYRHRPLSP